MMKSLRHSKTLWVFLSLCMCQHITTRADDKMTEGIDAQLLKTVVSIEVHDDRQRGIPIGTGFLVTHPSGMIALVTAKHVIAGEDGTPRGNLAYRLNLIDRPSVLIPDAYVSQYAGPWFRADNDDLAIRFMVLGAILDIKALGYDFFLASERIQPGAQVLIAGFPMGKRSETHTVPIVRRGIVANPTGKTILVDGFTFPGNSGGPVFYIPTIKVGGGLTPAFINRDMLIGIVSSQLSYVETAISQQT